MITTLGVRENGQQWSISHTIDAMTDEQLVDFADHLGLAATALRRLTEVRNTLSTQSPGQARVNRSLVIPVPTTAAPVTLLEVAISSLAEIGWRGADLTGANLNGAVLKGIKLVGALFWDADLRNADLTQADLRWTSLWHADMRGADLSGANLEYASMWGASLKGVCYSEKTVWPAGFDPNRYGMHLDRTEWKKNIGELP